jgi:hypothetical protein
MTGTCIPGLIGNPIPQRCQAFTQSAASAIRWLALVASQLSQLDLRNQASKMDLKYVS